MPGACDRRAAPRGGMHRRPRRHRNCETQDLAACHDGGSRRATKYETFRTQPRLTRHRHSGVHMGSLIEDVRYGARLLARNPGFTAVAVLSLAIGIGANTGIFSLVDSVLLRPLAVSHPEELVAI